MFVFVQVLVEFRDRSDKDQELDVFEAHDPVRARKRQETAREFSVSTLIERERERKGDERGATYHFLRSLLCPPTSTMTIFVFSSWITSSTIPVERTLVCKMSWSDGKYPGSDVRGNASKKLQPPVFRSRVSDPGTLSNSQTFGGDRKKGTAKRN